MSLDGIKSNLEFRSSGKSLLSIHLDLLEGQTPEDDRHLLENQQVAEIRRGGLPILRHSNRKHFKAWHLWSPVLALSTILLFLVFTSKSEDPYSIKGQTKIQLIVEHLGMRGPLADNEAIVAGDRINAEVISGEATSSFMIVKDQNQVTLWSAEEILKNSLELNAGKKGYFKVALELDNVDQGEVLTVVTCNSKSLIGFSSNRLEFISQLSQNFKSKSLESFLTKNCDVKSRKLRTQEGQK